MLELNKLHLMDCMDGMREFPDKYFDLAIVDPPYGLDKSSTTGSGKLKNRILNTEKIGECWDYAPGPEYFDELFRVSKNQIIWGGNYFELPPCRCFIVWDKKQFLPTFSRCEMAWTSFSKPAKIFEKHNGSNKIHPTQKPIELYEWLLQMYAKPGNIILDTHVGSASSLIACERAGFAYAGFEISERYYNLAQERMQSERAQIRF